MDLPVSFHLQSEQFREKFTFTAMVGEPPRHFAFNNSPHFDIGDFVAFQPFRAQDGSGTYGATFQMDESGTRRLMTISQAKTGQYLCTKVNGQVVDMLRIDTRIDDGRIVVWSGIPENVIEDLRIIFPLINPNNPG